MIFIKDKLGDKYFIDDAINVKGSNTTGIKIINILIDKLKPFRPENGSPTLLLKELLQDYDFTIIDYELPVIEQAESIIF